MNPHNMLEALSEILDKYVKTDGLSACNKNHILDDMVDKFLKYREKEAIERLNVRLSQERGNLNRRISEIMDNDLFSHSN